MLNDFFANCWNSACQFTIPTVCWLCVSIRIHTVHTYIHTYIRTYVHTYIHTYCTYTYIHTYIHTYVHTYVHTYIRTYVHTYIHTYVHTYLCMYAYTEPADCEDGELRLGGGINGREGNLNNMLQWSVGFGVSQ